MCVVIGSIDHATSTCRMCKAFKPQFGRCPHVTDVCRNRSNHPTGDVQFYRNAEVTSFNTCGFCKWARANPTAKPIHNPGWPGCCRPPGSGEHKLIQIADWPSVSTIHHIPIPSDVKSILDTLGFQRIPTFANNSTNTRGAMTSQPPSMSRRSSAVVASALRNEITPVKTSSLPIPAKLKGSPQQTSPPSSNTSSRAAAEASLSSAASANGMDQIVLPRRPLADTPPEKRRDHSREPKQSPGRKNAELTGTLPRKSVSQRPPLSNIVPATRSSLDGHSQSRKGAGGNASPPPSNTSRGTERSHERSSSISTLRQRSPLELDVSGLSISSGSSSASSDSGDGSETTVISDGGFTDYLSDESEAELQRQAEIRAAIVAQTQVEEQEFRAARQQLANIDLRPPRSWTSNVNSTPRSQNGAPAINGSYGPESQHYSSPPYAGQATTPSRV